MCARYRDYLYSKVYENPDAKLYLGLSKIIRYVDYNEKIKFFLINENRQCYPLLEKFNMYDN